MTRFDGDDLTGARLTRVRLTGARLRMVDLSGAVLRSVSLAGATIDGADLDGLRIDGVEVAPLVEAERRRREPGRVWRDATDAAGLRAAWTLVQDGWAATYARVAAMPAGTVDVSVEDEWSFTGTLRHLVFVTDGWLGAVRGERRPFHPWGLPFTDLAEFVPSVDALGLDPAATPSYEQVLALRAERVGRVADVLAGAGPDELAREVEGPPWAGERLSVFRCLRVILDEECEHHRYAVRDLDAIGRGA